MIRNIEALAGRSPELLPPRELAYQLRGVYERVADGCRELLTLQLDGASLTFRADPDTDTLETEFLAVDFDPTPEFHTVANSAPWSDFVGRECGWTWFAVNQQGYCDTALLSFDGIVPNVLLHVIGSSVEAFTIARG